MDIDNMSISDIKERIKDLRIEKALDEIFNKFFERFQVQGDNKHFFMIRDFVDNREILKWSEICEGLYIIEITGNYDGLLEISFKTNQDKLDWVRENIFVKPERSTKYG